MASGASATLRAGDLSLSYAPLGSVGNVERLPYSLRILLENALRFESESGVEAVAQWQPQDEPSRELGFRPSRVLLQDFTGVPAIVDVAAMRSAMADLGGDPAKINPHIPAELVIDHSVQVDAFATRMAISTNVDRDYERNGERYAFLRWGQGAFDNLKVVPPNTGIVHQVNLEYLARVVEERDGVAFPDTLVGTDSHTTMVNGLGVLGWGVGGIEAEAALLGEELSMLVPQVVGVRLDGRLREGATATDLVLTITELLRKTGVVGKFVEYFGPGLAGLALADRATLGNMSPEYGATCGFFPVDDLTLAYLRLTGRPEERVGLVEAYCKENLLWHDESVEPEYSQVVELDLDSVEPSLAGPRRPQDRVPLAEAKDAFLDSLSSFGHGYGNGTIDKSVEDSFPASDPASFQEPGPHTMDPEVATVATKSRPHLHVATAELDGEEVELQDGSVVIAAITSCTNTSNPQVMLGAALLAKKAVERGLAAQAVGQVLARAGLARRHRLLRQGRPDAVPRAARLQHGRLRLHDLHRELRAAARADLGRGRGGRPRRLRGALGQPQLRGAHPPRGEGELPRLAAAGRRLRTRRPHGPRPRDRADRPGLGRRGRLPARPLADERRDRAGGRDRARRRHVPQAVRRRLHRRRALAGAARSPRATSTTGATTRPTSGGRRSSRACRASPSRCPTSRARAAWSRSATASPPTTSRPPARSSPRARPASG